MPSITRLTLAATTALLAACSSLQPTSTADMTACEAQATEKAPGDLNPSRLRLIDECVTGRGWRASKGCVESNSQGTRFCDYVR